MKTLPISYDDVVKAHERIQGIAHYTPVVTSTIANERVGASLYFKCENLQRVGAFKFRGACNALARLTPEQTEKGVIAYSSGNHAQAIALSAKLRKMRAVILMPQDAPVLKVQATQGYGAEVIFYDRYTQDREALGQEIAQDQGLTLIPPYNHPDVMAGQGTVAKEFFEQVPDLDVLITPLGGGGLLSGCAVAAKALKSSCTVIGVEPEAGNDGQQSFRTGKIVHIPTPVTLADGAQTQHLGHHTFAVIQQLVDDIVTATDPQLVEAMAFLAQHLKLMVEPTGCLGLASVFQNTQRFQGKKIGIVLSGGNVDLKVFSECILGLR